MVGSVQLIVDFVWNDTNIIQKHAKNHTKKLVIKVFLSIIHILALLFLIIISLKIDWVFTTQSYSTPNQNKKHVTHTIK